jgi:hypothetical protein
VSLLPDVDRGERPLGDLLRPISDSVISPSSLSAVVAMVVVTTMVTPPALKWSLARATRRRPAVA